MLYSGLRIKKGLGAYFGRWVGNLSCTMLDAWQCTCFGFGSYHVGFPTHDNNTTTLHHESTLNHLQDMNHYH